MSDSTTMPVPQPRLDPAEETRRRRERWLAAVALVLIAVGTAFELRLSHISEGLPVTNNLLFFAVVNINVILTLLLVFLVFRNVAKLLFDRRSHVRGLSLRTKLILAIAGFTLVPSLLLFSVATGFVVNGVNSWFDPFVERSLNDALEVARDYYQQAEDESKAHAEHIASALSNAGLAKTDTFAAKDREAIADALEKQRDELKLDEIEVFDPTGASVSNAFNRPKFPGLVPGQKGQAIPAVEPDFVAKAMNGETASRTNPLGDSDVVRGAAPLWPRDCPEYGRTDTGQPIRGCHPAGVVVVSTWVPQSLLAKTHGISNAFSGYRQVKVFKNPLKTSYVTMLTTITLLVVFAATWLGIHLSREIAVPLNDLADATKAVAGGNLDVVVPDRGGDEIGQVVDAFNKMTGDLKSSRAGLEAANTDLKRSNVELEQRRRYMEVVLTNIAAGVVAVDRDGRFSAINAAAAKLLAVDDPATVIGQRWREALPDSFLAVARDFVRDLEATGEAPSVSRQVAISIRGEVKTVMVTVTALRDETLGYLGMVVVLDDLTPILRAQRVAAWREVARRIAHEIKNPLTPVQLSAQRLRRRFAEQIGDGKEVFDECTATIEKQVEELRRMVNEFSEFARLPEARPKPTDLNATVGEVVALYKNAHVGIAIELAADPAVPTFDLDREQIKRAVINLVDNAVAAVQEGQGSRVDVTTAYDRALGIVRVTVADDGRGIAEDVKGRLFEPYFSTKKGGTGLGLTIVHRIVADHEGFIRVQDNPPKGTRFIVELPAKGAEIVARAARGTNG